MRWTKIFGFGFLGLLGLLVVGAAALFYFKPWSPPSQVLEPGPTGKRITEDGLLGNYYPAPDGKRAPAILLFGGSEGGLGRYMSHMAKELQKQGFTVLHLSYWRGPGQPVQLREIPIEYFGKGLEWLKQQPQVDASNLAIAGWSRGSEAAMLTANQHPELKAVILGMPASSVWPAFDWDAPWATADTSAWSLDKKPVPFVSFKDVPFSFDRKKANDAIDKIMEKTPEAEIDFAAVRAPIIMICGEKDQIWSSCTMARLAKQRAEDGGKTNVTLLAYPDAGHVAYGAPFTEKNESLERASAFGGTYEANNAALRDGFEKIVAFLDEAFDADRSASAEANAND